MSERFQDTGPALRSRRTSDGDGSEWVERAGCASDGTFFIQKGIKDPDDASSFVETVTTRQRDVPGSDVTVEQAVNGTHAAEYYRFPIHEADPHGSLDEKEHVGIYAQRVGATVEIRATFNGKQITLGTIT